MVGSKIDLRDDSDTIKKLKEKDQEPISYEKGVQMKELVNAAHYGECSAKTQQGLKEIFLAAIDCVLKEQYEEQTSKDGKTTQKKKKKECLLQ